MVQEAGCQVSLETLEQETKLALIDWILKDPDNRSFSENILAPRYEGDSRPYKVTMYFTGRPDTLASGIHISKDVAYRLALDEARKAGAE